MAESSSEGHGESSFSNIKGRPTLQQYCHELRKWVSIQDLPSVMR
ncbi:unnamed protein product [Haemonchus placei]|uniref:Uncharacterized protein n=1 Tax=Haemonchus placei TaxID=6290 RepID=A0A0N4X6G3_HAEPC|nr:unnamed protein product [Haemonchus placei]